MGRDVVALRISSLTTAENEPVNGFPAFSWKAPLKNPAGSAATIGASGLIGVNADATASLEPTRNRNVPELPTPGS